MIDNQTDEKEYRSDNSRYVAIVGEVVNRRSGTSKKLCTKRIRKCFYPATIYTCAIVNQDEFDNFFKDSDEFYTKVKLTNGFSNTNGLGNILTGVIIQGQINVDDLLILNNGTEIPILEIHKYVLTSVILLLQSQENLTMQKIGASYMGLN